MSQTIQQVLGVFDRDTGVLLGLQVLGAGDVIQVGGAGTVKSINSLAPDANGNIVLAIPGGTVKTINASAPDANGNITLTIPGGTVKSINTTQPDVNGNVTLAIPAGTVKSINSTNPDANGNVVIAIPPGTVKSVNSANPDANGNVVLTIPGGTVKTINSSAPDVNGNVVISIPGGTVKSVNSFTPDVNGAVTLQGIVKTINSATPDVNGNLVITANSLGCDSQVIAWNLTTNLATNPDATTFTPTNGTFPAKGFNVLLCGGPATGTQTLDGNVFVPGDVAIMSPSMGVWVRVPYSGVKRASILTAAAAYTGATTISPTQGTLVIEPSGTGSPLVPGTRYEVELQTVLSGTNDTTRVDTFINGSATAYPSAGFTSVAYYDQIHIRMMILVLTTTSIAVWIKYECSNSTASSTLQRYGVVTTNIDTTHGLSLDVKFTNSTTTKTAQLVYADARTFPAG